MARFSKKSFVEFLLQNQVLMIGSFITKSGRKTPYFFNFGRIYEGKTLRVLAGAYAQLIIKKFVANPSSVKQSPLVIYGPAYKGIPLAVAVTLELQRRGVLAMYAFNRKEAKTHGDKGVLVGKELTSKDRVVIIDDVITSGISIGNSIHLITKTFRAKVLGVVVAIDREEAALEKKNNLKSSSNLTSTPTAAEKLVNTQHIGFYSIMKIKEVFITALQNKLIAKKDYQRFSTHLFGEKV